jgi:hypothetical protein
MRRHLLAAAVVGPVWPVDVVKANNSRLEPELAGVVQAQALGNELFPAVGVLRAGRVGVLLLQRSDVRLGLQVVGVDTRRGAEQITRSAVHTGCLERVDVDQRVVPQDRGVVGRDESHAPMSAASA